MTQTLLPVGIASQTGVTTFMSSSTVLVGDIQRFPIVGDPRFDLSPALGSAGIPSRIDFGQPPRFLTYVPIEGFSAR